MNKNNNKNISLKTTITNISIENGNFEEPIINNTQSDIQNFMSISNMSMPEVKDVVNHPKNYTYVTYTVKLENNGDVDLTLKSIGESKDDNIWLLNQQDGWKTVLSHSETNIRIFALFKNSGDIKRKVSIPLVFEYSSNIISKGSVTIWVTQTEQ